MEKLSEEMQEETLNFVQFLHNKLEKKVDNLPTTEPNGIALARLIAERGTAFKEIKDLAARVGWGEARTPTKTARN